MVESYALKYALLNNNMWEVLIQCTTFEFCDVTVNVKERNIVWGYGIMTP